MDLQAPITRAEHNEFVKRIEEHDERQDARIKGLETDVGILKDMSSSIKQMASSMEQMLEEQKSQGERLSHLENKDGENWRNLMKYIGSALVGGIIAYLLKVAGLY